MYPNSSILVEFSLMNRPSWGTPIDGTPQINQFRNPPKWRFIVPFLPRSELLQHLQDVRQSLGGTTISLAKVQGPHYDTGTMVVRGILPKKKPSFRWVNDDNLNLPSTRKSHHFLQLRRVNDGKSWQIMINDCRFCVTNQTLIRWLSESIPDPMLRT